MLELVKDFQKYKKLMYILFGIGLLSILSSFMVEEDSISGLLAGFGTSLSLVGAFNLIVMFAKKKKDEQYEEDMSLEFTDERLGLNKLKILAYSGIVGMFALAISNVLHLLFETDLLISNIVVIFGYTITLIGLKLFYKNR